MKPQAFIFIGRSGSGKGTQANLLIEELKSINSSISSLYIQSGQRFREFIQGNLFTQKKSKEYYDNGILQPEFLAVDMWIGLLVEKYSGAEHLIFDGTPRKLHEAGVLESVFDFYNLDKPFVIHIDIAKDESLKRLLLRKRLDDTKDDILKRLSWYETDVVPTVNYYRDNPKYTFIEVDGNGSVEDIHKDIIGKLGLK
jgi:adenylate kinase family enzyme